MLGSSYSTLVRTHLHSCSAMSPSTQHSVAASPVLFVYFHGRHGMTDIVLSGLVGQAGDCCRVGLGHCLN